MFELTGLRDHVAIVTGAGRMRSTGRPIALALARAGCDLVLTSSGRSPDRPREDEQAVGWEGIDAVAREVSELGRRALPVVSDVTDPNAVESLIDRVMDEFGRIDVLVNNAAASRGADRQPVTELPIDIWHHVIDVNLHGTFYMSRAVARKMKEAGTGGSIVNISSIGAKIMAPDTSAYSASKLAIHALTSTMAGELGASQIRVNAICPGVIDTSRVDDMDRNSTEWLDLMRSIPLGRPGTGDDVASLTVFLCSEQGSWITGQQWNIDGGHLMIH